MYFTRTAELLALDLTDAFVGEPSRTGAPRTAGLNRVRAQKIRQPLQATITDKRILGQMTGKKANNETSKFLSKCPYQWALYKISYRVWMDFSGANVPFARDWILLS